MKYNIHTGTFRGVTLDSRFFDFVTDDGCLISGKVSVGMDGEILIERTNKRCEITTKSGISCELLVCCVEVQ